MTQPSTRPGGRMRGNGREIRTWQRVRENCELLEGTATTTRHGEKRRGAARRRATAAQQHHTAQHSAKRDKMARVEEPVHALSEKGPASTMTPTQMKRQVSSKESKKEGIGPARGGLVAYVRVVLGSTKRREGKRDTEE